jgi:hypothetical protein
MKKLTIFLAACLTTIYSYAQNTFPPSGNVGIGNTDPNTILDIYNSANSSTTLLRVSGSAEANSSYTGLLLGAGGLKGRAKGAVLYQPYGTSYGLGRLHFAVNGNPGEGEASLSDIRMTILGNGYVGIGTTIPGSLLQVNGVASFRSSTDTDGYLSINPGGPTVQGYINWWKPGNVRVGYLGYNDGTSTNNLALTLEASANFVINGGSVGIGTTTPDAKLAVNGTIHTKEVKVDLTGWPDYVFRPDYHLPSLAAVRTYIGQNHHLLEMPSEQEVAKDGINLGEIVKLQTKKIEELTLYLLEKDEQDKQKQAQIDQLKQQVETLIKKRS